MKTAPAKLLEVVALLEDRAGTSLKAGQVGTIVESHGAENDPAAYEVEFSDKFGRTIEFAALKRHKFLVLLPTPEAVAV